ncbi:MerR family transcriptional regulator [Micrococcus endophyticus]|uniref:MerR family transcriptional regulator n=1 Tax=Micrococcus endophyticus TaxID=455343 RepID=UPI0010C8095C|nr:MerR family transcriptional regulator [Micrococcus luteus]
MVTHTDLMTIGEFSSLSRLSVRMLRHYDAHGVLVPEHVDAHSGYRRYAPAQLRDAADIRNLRDVGLGVSAITALLAARGTSTWTDALALQRCTLVEELHAARERLSLIDRMLTPGEIPMTIQLNRTAVPAMTVVALRGTVPSYSDEGRLWERLMPALQQQGIRPVGPCGVIEHDDEYREADVDLSVYCPVAPGTRAEGPLVVLQLPERDCLVAHVIGPYTQISQAHDLIVQRMEAEGLAARQDGTLASNVFNRYLVTPDQAAPEDLVTEVCRPLA